MRRSWTKELLALLVMVIGVCIVSAIVRTCVPEEAAGVKQAGEWVPLGPYSGGLNTSANAGQLGTGQVLEAENFIWKTTNPTALTDPTNPTATPEAGPSGGGAPEVREGFYRLAEPLSAHAVKFLDIFRTINGAAYLIYSDGERVWYRPNLTGAAVELNFGRSNAGTVDFYSGRAYVHGNTVGSQKFRTVFGSGEGLTVAIGGTSYTVEKIILDTLIELTANFGSTDSLESYNIDVSEISITGGQQMNNKYWLYANVGKAYFGGPDDFVLVDSLSGTRYQYSAINRVCFGGPMTGLRFTASGVDANFGGRFARITTNPLSVGGTANPVPAGQPFYMSYPIWSSGNDSIKTFAAAFLPDSTSSQYVTIEALEYDSTSKFTRRVDSVRVATTATVCGTENARYLKIYCDSCFFDADTASFITGDWFVSPNYPWSYSGLTAASYWNGYIWTSVGSVFPVVGGYRASDGAWLAACPPDVNDGIAWDIDSNNVEVVFYRMKRAGVAAPDGIEWAGVFNNSAVEVRSDEKDVVYRSAVNLPDSFLSDRWMIVDHGQPIVVGGLQRGDLVLYTAVNRWALIEGGSGYFSKQYLDGARGCIAKGSFLNIDGVHYGLAADGYWESTGDAPRLISGAVSSYFTDSLDRSRLDEFAAGYDAELDNIWLSCPNWTLVYNRATGSWWPQSWKASAFTYNPDVTVSDSVRLIAGGIDSSGLFARGGSDDDGDSLVAWLRTGYLDFGVPQRVKDVKGLRIGYESPRAMTFDVTSYRQFASTSFDEFQQTMAAGWSEKWLRFYAGRYRGKNFSQKWTWYNASGLRLPYVLIDVKQGREE